MEASFDAMKLKTFKYTELQALAKRYGIRANMKHDKLVQHIKQHLLTSNSSSTESSESSSIPMVDISELQPVKRGRKGASSHKNEQLADAIKELIFSNNNANTNSSPAKSGRNPQASPHKSKKLSSTDLRPAQEAQKPVTKKKGRSRQQKKSVETHQEENHSASSLEPSADEAAAVQPDSSVTTDVPADDAEVSRRRTRWRTCSQPNEPPPMALKRKRTDEQADHLNMVTERVRKRQRKNETSVAESNVMQSDEDDDEVILNIPIATSETHNHQTTSAEDQGDATRSNEAVEQLKPAVEEEEVVEEEEEKAAASSSQSSPGVRDMVASMQSGMDKAAMKASLEEVLERRVQDKQGTAQDSFHHSTATMSTLIPRLTALSGHKTTAANGKRTVTPGNRNWTAIHERQFRKMDSLDVYMRKKHARTNSMMSSSVKQVQQMTEQMRYALTSLKSHKTPQTAKFAKVIKGEGGGDKQKSMLFQSPSAPFVPRVTNTTHMNLNFGRNMSNATPKGAKKTETAAKENSASEGRQRLAGSVGKPAACARKSGIVDSVRKMPLLNSVRKSLSTPQQPMSAVKKFDLKSSLAKPITWKPHTGKLQPFQVDQVYNHHQVDVKKVKVQTRDDRRRAADKHRSNQRLNAQMKRRGQLA